MRLTWRVELKVKVGDSYRDLTLKHMELVAQGQDFGLQLGARLAADDEDLQQETSYGVGKSEEHDRRGSHGRPAMPRSAV